MVMRSPAATRLSKAGKCVFASKAPTSMTVLLQTGLIWLIVVESAKTGNWQKIGR
jgi:hypothetical protein